MTGERSAWPEYLRGRQDGTPVERTPPDALGHGSALARVILQHAPGAALLDARVFGASRRTTPEAVAAGLDWLREEGARMVNMSFGLRHDRAVLRGIIACRQK